MPDHQSLVAGSQRLGEPAKPSRPHLRSFRRREVENELDSARRCREHLRARSSTHSSVWPSHSPKSTSRKAGSISNGSYGTDLSRVSKQRRIGLTRHRSKANDANASRSRSLCARPGAA